MRRKVLSILCLVAIPMQATAQPQSADPPASGSVEKSADVKKPDTAPADPRPVGAPHTDGGLKTFAPGVHIDWKHKTVEVDAKVVLREGPLELLMCTVGSKEHESILATTARPRDIFQALGLVGFDPGTPVRWDESGKKLLPPEGHKLDITVRCREDSKEVSHILQRWLMTADEKPVEDELSWVFSGSRKMEEGRFGADVEGTVVCVVDFDTALISVGGLHSADDEQLWLRANPKTIPPRGTKCRLIIAAAEAPAVPTGQP